MDGNLYLILSSLFLPVETEEIILVSSMDGGTKPRALLLCCIYVLVFHSICTL